MPSAAAADRITGRRRLAGGLIPHVHALLLKHYCGHAPDFVSPQSVHGRAERGRS